MELTKSQISDNTAFLLTTPITYGVKRWGKKNFSEIVRTTSEKFKSDAQCKHRSSSATLSKV